MVQSTFPSTGGQAEAVRDQFAQQTGLVPRCLFASEVESTLPYHNHKWRARIYTPWTTWNMFLAQIFLRSFPWRRLGCFQKYRKD